MRLSKAFILILLFTLAAFALRVYRLDFFSLRGDESFTVLFVQKPLAQMWAETLTVEPNPPLLYFALRAWIDAAGDSEWVTRFFSVFFGVLCVPLVYRVAREMASAKAVALGAAFLVAVNPYQIWHSQDVRNYTMWPAFSLLALVFFWKWYRVAAMPFAARPLESPRVSAQNALPLLWFVLAELAALYTHYYEAFVLLALNVFVFATLWRDLKKLLPWLGAQVVLAILYLPYPLVLSNRVSAYGEGSGRQGVALWDIARETFSAFVLSDTLDENLRAWLWVPFALLAFAGLIFWWTRDWKRGLFFVFYVAVPTLCVFGLNTIRPLYLERYLNGIAPACYLLIAFGVVAVWNFFDARAPRPFSRFTFYLSRLALVVAVAFIAYLALANYWTNPAYAKAPDWRGLTRIINTNAQRGDIIVQNFPETSLLYYDTSKLPLVVYPETFLPDTKTEQQLNAMNANYQRVWFIPAAPDYWDPYQFVEAWLHRKDDLLKDWRAGELQLQLYGTPSYFLNAMNSSGTVFGGTLRLSGYRTTRDGNTLRVVLYWRALETPNKNFEMEVQTFQSGKGALETIRRIPVRGEYPTTEWRKNQLLVDQYDFEHSANATDILLRVCDALTNACLPIGDSTMAGPLTLPIKP